MSTKRPREDGDSRKEKPRHAFRVGPENLPDGAWRRKVTKIKKELITKAKVKKQYARVKAEFQQHNPSPSALPIPTEELEPVTLTQNHPPEETTNDQDEQRDKSTPPPQIHPDRQAMLGSPKTTTTTSDHLPNPSDYQPEEPRPCEHRDRNRRRRPDYFAKDLATGDRVKAEAEARAAEKARREEEKARRIAERELYRRRMAKAKTPGRDGKRKLGRESGLLLDRVRRLVEG